MSEAQGTEIPYKFIHFLDNILNFFRKSRVYDFLHADQECWALVTGASDGIGEGLANELAERGFNIILHGRNAEKLEKKETLLKSKYKVKTRLWIADATEPLSKESLEETVGDLHLTLLVNNVGGHPGNPYGFLEDRGFDYIDQLIAMNVTFATKAEATLLPTLIRNQPSGIVNISSVATIGAPYVSVFSGAKAYLNAHSRALQSELSGRKHDVIVHSIITGLVTNSSNNAKMGFGCCSARTMGKAILDNIGLRGCVMAPYLPHMLQVKLMNILPEKLVSKILFQAVTKNIEEGVGVVATSSTGPK